MPGTKSSSGNHSRSGMKKKSRKAAASCQNCAVALGGRMSKSALLVEEEVGRIFCSQKCIAGYFSPEIKKLEKEYFKRLSPRDLNGEERESFAHLRWETLQSPNEIWREKTVSGDHRFTLISEFSAENRRPIWCVCICLFLRGAPSFLYLAFPTKNAAMTNQYRRGEQIFDMPLNLNQENDQLERASNKTLSEAKEMSQKTIEDLYPDEKLQTLTLEKPDEVWAFDDEELGSKVFHFIKFFSGEPWFWYVVVTRDIGRDELEIMDSFTSNEPSVVERFRTGNLELLAEAEIKKVLH